MGKSILLAFLSVAVVVFQFSVSLAAAPPAGSLHDSFLKCFASHTDPSEKISNIVYAQTDPSYSSVLRAYIRNARFNTSSAPKPLLIVTPSLKSHVQAAVICAKTVNIQIKIRSGGHDYEGISYISDETFIILDLFNLRNIIVDMYDLYVVMQAGATLGEVYYRIWEKTKVYGFPAGICPTLGVGGHLSGGGYGNMIRRFGLSVDHIVDAEIVDANGKLMNKTSMGEDLFWAIRGGGGASFGVILSYTIRLVPVPETVTVFRVENSLDENPRTTDFVVQWQQVAPTTDPRLFMRMLMQPVSSNVNKGQMTIKASVVALFLGGADELVKILGKEFPLMALQKENCTELSWIDSVTWWAFNNVTKPEALLDRNPDSAKFLKRKSDYVQSPISKENLELIWKKLLEVGKCGFVFNPYGGIMSEFPADAAPFPHRAGNLFKMQYSVTWDEAGPSAENDYLNRMRILYSFMTPFVSKNPRSAFLNYRDLDIGVNGHGDNSYKEGKVYGEKYFNNNFDRLVKVKTSVDPENFFRNEQSIPTLPK